MTNRADRWTPGVANIVLLAVLGLMAFAGSVWVAHMLTDQSSLGLWFFVLFFAGLGAVLSAACIVACRVWVGICGNVLRGRLFRGYGWWLNPKFRTIAIPLTDLHSVEVRQEIAALTLFDSVAIVTVAGERIVLGRGTREAATTLPLRDVAIGVAQAAGLPVRDAGTVEIRMFGTPADSWDEQSIGEERWCQLRRLAVGNAIVVVAAMVLWIAMRVTR